MSKTAYGYGMNNRSRYTNNQINLSFDSQDGKLAETNQPNSIYETSMNEAEEGEYRDVLRNHARQMISFKNVNQGSRLKNKDLRGYHMKLLNDDIHEWNSTDAKREKMANRERPLLFRGNPLVSPRQQTTRSKFKSETKTSYSKERVKTLAN